MVSMRALCAGGREFESLRLANLTHRSIDMEEYHKYRVYYYLLSDNFNILTAASSLLEIIKGNPLMIL